ncbi:hypothetical protein ABTX81_03555 [Kitasatospora sp. NPDC097605]|uniref:hypothetical protein n=1 Tax=Kitasatospora sp. NPDC097605 TaxID=3157226 RepID=UPI003334963C
MAVRSLIVGVAAGIGVGVVMAVHTGGRLPLVPALCVDGFVLVAWLSLAALAFPRRRPPLLPVEEGPGLPVLAELRYRAESEPRATAHWRGRHWP